jgi:hypothetical protein
MLAELERQQSQAAEQTVDYFERLLSEAATP